jgi:hypothetical protein
MQITVIDVGAPNTHAAKNGRTYQSLEVTYKNEQGQAQSKKLMSFSNPQVFKAAQTWEKGTQVNVSTEKDANGYWQWTGLGGDTVVADNKPAATGGNSTRVTGSNYETKEERAARQVYIIRQSSISSAIDLLKDSKPTVEGVLEVAKQFEDYIFAQKTGVDAINDLDDDIPL